MCEEAAAPALTVIVPAYEEGPRLRERLARVVAVAEGLGRSFEVVVVDDGSRDATRAGAQSAAAADPRVRVVAHEENRGKGAALASGCAAARGAVLVFLDADLEIAPEEIGPLLARMEAAGAAVAVGSKWLGAARRRPLHREALSLAYLAVTSVLFRLPIRDTQTGLKAMDAALARRVVPAIRARRWAWDVELLLLAHRLGARIVQGPVAVDFLREGTRIGRLGLVASAFDTFATFVRDRFLAAYAPVLRQARPPRAAPRRARFVASGDDLGLSSSVDRGLLAAASAGRLLSVSFLAEGPTAGAAAASLLERAPDVDVGVHVDLAGDRPARFLARSLLGLVPARDVRAAVRRQVTAARALGLCPTHVDAHRHAFLASGVYRAVASEARAMGILGIRFPAPLGTMRAGAGAAGVVKALVLTAAGIALRGAPRAAGMASPDGIADAAAAEAWAARGRLPAACRGRTVEVVAHPAEGDDDLPAAERGIDRLADARRLASLRSGLEALGVQAVDFRTVARDSRPSVAATILRSRRETR